jgi:hypothetical protein
MTPDVTPAIRMRPVVHADAATAASRRRPQRRRLSGSASAAAWFDGVGIVFMADLYCWQLEVRVKAPCLSES